MFNFIKGFLLISITGFEAEGFLNKMASYGIKLWNVKAQSGEATAYISIRDFRRIRHYGKCRVHLHIERRFGVPFIIKRYSRRWGLIIGMLALIFILWAMSSVVWTIQVEGNEKVETSLILNQLQEFGFTAGVRMTMSELREIQDRMIIAMPELVWITINIKGTKATVIVQERVIAPEIIPEDEPCNVVASRSGYILSVEAYDGVAHVKPGDSVSRGALLVGGVIDSRMEGMRLVHAQAKVMARTMRVITGSQPLNYSVRVQTGASIQKKKINILGFTLNLYLNSSILYDNYDIIVTGKEVKIFGLTLPLKTTITTYCEVNVEEHTLTFEKASELAWLDAEQKAMRLGDIAVKLISSREVVSNRAYSVELTYECIEDIAVKRSIEIEMDK